LTDRIAFVLGLIIVMSVVLDFVVNDGVASLFLLRKFDALVEWTAFWR
jgi:hypothetical protein